jgi:hypothetical protein
MVKDAKGNDCNVLLQYYHSIYLKEVRKKQKPQGKNSAQ